MSKKKQRAVQLDHVTPWGSGHGETSDENLILLCEAHNHAKQLTHWTARLDPATTETVWTNRRLGIVLRTRAPAYD